MVFILLTPVVSKMEIKKPKILRITTVPISLKILLKGQQTHLSNNNFEVHCMSSEGDEIAHIKESENIAGYHIINLGRKISPFQDLIAIWQCVKIINKLKPDIVHSYTPKAGMIGMIAAYLCRIKIRMHNITGLPLMEKSGYLKFILINIEKLIYYLSTDTYVNSVGLKNYIYLNISTKVKLLGNGSTNGIDSQYFKKSQLVNNQSAKIKKKYAISDLDFIWIFVGRLVKDKGISELIIAFEKFNQKYNTTKLLLIGNQEPHLDPLPDDILLKLDKNKSILKTGFQSDIRPYLNLSDCLLFPSYREGLPNVPLQAACFDLPIIATNINGCNEIIEDNFNGLLIKSKDADSLFLAMEKIYLDEKLREKMQTHTRSFVVSKFDQKLVWSLLVSEYNRLLKCTHYS